MSSCTPPASTCFLTCPFAPLTPTWAGGNSPEESLLLTALVCPLSCPAYYPEIGPRNLPGAPHNSQWASDTLCGRPGWESGACLPPTPPPAPRSRLGRLRLKPTSPPSWLPVTAHPPTAWGTWGSRSLLTYRRVFSHLHCSPLLPWGSLTHSTPPGPQCKTHVCSSPGLGKKQGCMSVAGRGDCCLPKARPLALRAFAPICGETAVLT